MADIPRSRTPEYVAWNTMLFRCYNKKSHNYANYGGRGISVCEQWRNSFDAFLAHIGPRPSKGFSLDRINNEGNYEPGNVRWATQSQQLRNTRLTRRIDVNGELVCLTELANRLGIKKQSLFSRLQGGWSIDRIISTPPRRNVSLDTVTQVLVHRSRGLTYKNIGQILGLKLPTVASICRTKTV